MNRTEGSALLLAALLAHPSGAQVQTQEQPAHQESGQFSAQLDSLILQRQYARAEQTVQQRLATGADPATVYFQIGKAYFDHEQWQRSAESLQKSLKVKDRNDEAHQLLGLDWRELRRPDQAEAELIEAAKENPSNRVNVYFAGHQLLLNGKFEAALPYLYSALDSKPPLQFQVLQALALAQARLGNYGLAESYYRKTIDSAKASDPGLYPALMNLTVLLLLGHDPARIEEALSCALRAQKLQPDSAEAHFLTGKALFKLKRIQEAGPELAKAASLNPEDSKPHFLLARIYDELGQRDRAQEERNKVARIQSRPGQSGVASGEPLPVTPE
jgi:Flp pilus assembly protein TadD